MLLLLWWWWLIGGSLFVGLLPIELAVPSSVQFVDGEKEETDGRTKSRPD